MKTDKNQKNRKALIFAALAALLVASPLAFAKPLEDVVEDYTGPLPPVLDGAPGFALARIHAEGAQPDVLIPVGEGDSFDLVVMLPYVNSDNLGSNPSATLVLGDVRLGGWTGDVVIEDDPNSADVSGPVSLYFGGVAHEAAPYRLTLSWEPGNVYVLELTDTVPFEVLPIRVTGPEKPGEPNGTGLTMTQDAAGTVYYNGPSYSTSCRTNVNGGMGPNVAEASGTTSGGNTWKTYAKLNFNYDIYWYGTCNTGGPGMYSTGTGYAAAVRGPNNLARTGIYLIEAGVAHMGGGSGYGSQDGFGSKNVGAMPSLTLQKPPENKIRLEDSYIKGLNKQSCSTWPGELKTALSLIPVNYWWSVMVTFSPTTACSTNWQSLDYGSSYDLSRAGFKVTKSSVSTQYEHGGRIEVRAVNTGQFSMPFTYTDHIYGEVRAHGNNPVSFTATVPVTTSVTPKAAVV